MPLVLWPDSVEPVSTTHAYRNRAQVIASQDALSIFAQPRFPYIPSIGGAAFLEHPNTFHRALYKQQFASAILADSFQAPPLITYTTPVYYMTESFSDANTQHVQLRRSWSAAAIVDAVSPPPLQTFVYVLPPYIATIEHMGADLLQTHQQYLQRRAQIAATSHDRIFQQPLFPFIPRRMAPAFADNNTLHFGLQKQRGLASQIEPFSRPISTFVAPSFPLGTDYSDASYTFNYLLRQRQAATCCDIMQQPLFPIIPSLVRADFNDVATMQNAALQRRAQIAGTSHDQIFQQPLFPIIPSSVRPDFSDVATMHYGLRQRQAKIALQPEFYRPAFVTITLPPTTAYIDPFASHNRALGLMARAAQVGSLDRSLSSYTPNLPVITTAAFTAAADVIARTLAMFGAGAWTLTAPRLRDRKVMVFVQQRTVDVFAEYTSETDS